MANMVLARSDAGRRDARCAARDTQSPTLDWQASSSWLAMPQPRKAWKEPSKCPDPAASSLEPAREDFGHPTKDP